ncbi:MAG: hypothetical protein PHQ84_05270 [Candidatus Omnitrophica bacterium]|jgi:hypothetical protein|nr:hypothetical protein [Candidatus Omnitrophota bacterium]MDD3274820.1 hypothetical protein [Candidatus Omnitrophota bacterium]MDD5078393.1 hypothetical protein [Candidatus Omnitrophota bacterium]MDD5725355.1 hypothetical protein [Candidatus Omnitrophota bacterium]
MRDLLYKNLSFPNRGRRIISTAEITDKEGVHSVVRRHFSYIIKPIQKEEVVKPQPYLYLLKERNTKERREHFFCKIKGSVLAVDRGNLFLILFVHTLNINLSTSEKLSEKIG